MDERCVVTHAKLLAGTCPWCGRAIIQGLVVGDASLLRHPEEVEAAVSSSTSELATNLTWIIEHHGPLDYERAVRYVEDVARELVDIRHKGRLHGGVHPSNIFVDQDGAHIAPSIPALDDSNLDDNQLAGIVDCLAPEQAVGSFKVDCRADIYSLGCTLYFLLAGKPPYSTGSISQRLLQHQMATPEPLDKLRSDLPEPLLRICARMMAKKPSDRYASALEVIDALWTLR